MELETVKIKCSYIYIELSVETQEFASNKVEILLRTYFKFPILYKSNNSLDKFIRKFKYSIVGYSIQGCGKLSKINFYIRADLSLPKLHI